MKKKTSLSHPKTAKYGLVSVPESRFEGRGQLSPSVLIAGVDEVGRGPLVGPVMAAAVILDPKRPIEGLCDSKKLSEVRRETLYDLIREQALSWSVARATPAEIDALNILQASLLAMQRAVAGLQIKPNVVLVDGKIAPELGLQTHAIVKGDVTEPEISAASIIAKVTRDREMVAFAQQYPGYGIEQHKGYPTRAHLEALIRLGPTPEHRRSFGPVKALLADATS